MKSKQKWFYPMQERLKEKMRKAFPNWKASLQYDGERRVGVLLFDSTQAFDKLMIRDNE